VGPKTADYVDFGGGQSSGVVVSNCYFHGWYNPYWSIGTGNATAGSSTITNFVPYSYSQAPLNAWASSPAFATIGGGGVPEVSNGPLITGVSGSNPYTITTNGTASNFTNCSGCVITIGQDYLTITGGVEAQCLGCMMVGNVIDASDVNTVQLNPYGDCGLTESNNQVCWGSGIAGWRLPNIWRGNVIRFVNSAMVGGCSEWSNNLIEYLRLGSNPSSHTNGVECLGNWPINNISVFYNNVIRHTNNPNPSVPGGQWSIGLGQISAGPNANETDYFFGNVFYDGLQNVMFEKVTPNPSGSQSIYFNNTVDGGPTWQPNYALADVSANDIVANNQTITTMAAPALMGSGAGSVTPITSLVMTPTTATSDGYTTSQTYVYSPISSSSPTVNAGTNKSLYCTALAAYSSAAQAACLQDTTYGVSYNVSNHTAVSPARTPLSRPVGAWDIGAYQFNSSGGPGVLITPSPLAFNGVNLGSNATLTATVTDSGSTNLILGTPYYSITGSNAADFAVTGSPTCSNGGAVTPANSCTIPIKFTPSVASAETASLNIMGNATGSVTMTGTGLNVTYSMTINPGTSSGFYVQPCTTSQVNAATSIACTFPSAQTLNDTNFCSISASATGWTVYSFTDTNSNSYGSALLTTSLSGIGQQIVFLSSPIAAGSNAITVVVSPIQSYMELKCGEWQGTLPLD